MRVVAVLAPSALVVVGAWLYRPRTPQRRIGRAQPAVPAPVALVLARMGVDPSRHPIALRHVATAGAIGLLVAPVVPPAAVIGPAAGLARALAAERRHTRQAADAVARELPEAIDLLRLALDATGSLRSALGAVGEALDGPVGAWCAHVHDEAAAGARLADAIAGARSQLGPAARPLVRALLGSEYYGTPLAENLARLAAEARRARRRAAERQARRVPVRLLVPLVCCILPAFVVLTLVPVIARTLLTLGS